MTFRSLLFVPGARPDRFAKAMAAGADAVCIDLEDSTPSAEKAAARRETLSFLRSPPEGADIGLRLNALSSIDGFQDVVALAESGVRPAFVMLAKASGAAEIEQLRSVLSPWAPFFWPLIETPQALAAATEIARAVGAAGGILFGGADYSAATGSDMSFEALLHARGAIVSAAATAGCSTLDAPFLDVKDDSDLRAETRRVRALGFQGRAAIHPAQIPTINEVFTPTEDDIARAMRVVAAFRAGSGGAALLDGKLIERPVLRAAERVLAARKR